MERRSARRAGLPAAAVGRRPARVGRGGVGGGRAAAAGAAGHVHPDAADAQPAEPHVCAWQAGDGGEARVCACARAAAWSGATHYDMLPCARRRSRPQSSGPSRRRRCLLLAWQGRGAAASHPVASRPHPITPSSNRARAERQLRVFERARGDGVAARKAAVWDRRRDGRLFRQRFCDRDQERRRHVARAQAAGAAAAARGARRGSPPARAPRPGRREGRGAAARGAGDQGRAGPAWPAASASGRPLFMRSRPARARRQAPS